MSAPSKSFQLKPRHLLSTGLVVIAIAVTALSFSAWRELTRKPNVTVDNINRTDTSAKAVEILRPSGATQAVAPTTQANPYIINSQAPESKPVNDSETTAPIEQPRANTTARTQNRNINKPALSVQEKPLEPINTAQAAPPSKPKREVATNEQAGNTVKQPANNNGSKPKNVMDNLF